MRLKAQFRSQNNQRTACQGGCRRRGIGETSAQRSRTLPDPAMSGSHGGSAGERRWGGGGQVGITCDPLGVLTSLATSAGVLRVKEEMLLLSVLLSFSLFFFLFVCSLFLPPPSIHALLSGRGKGE